MWYSKHNHITFMVLPMLTEKPLTRNLCVIVLSAELRDRFGNVVACDICDNTVMLSFTKVISLGDPEDMLMVR